MLSHGVLLLKGRSNIRLDENDTQEQRKSRTVLMLGLLRIAMDRGEIAYTLIPATGRFLCSLAFG